MCSSPPPLCSVTIVGFVKGKLRIVATACERNAGGRDLDAAIAKHIAAEFAAKYGPSVCASWCLRDL